MIAILLVIVVVYIFLQGWRATLIPLLAVPVSLVGTFVFFPALRFLHQYALAVRTGSGDRPGGGRCHRRGGGSGTSHRRRPGSQGRGLQGDGRNLGPGDRHRAGSVRGVRAYGIHSGHHRTALPAIRRDDCDFRDPLGVQCAYAQPRAGGAAAQAKDGKPWAAEKVLQLVQPDVWTCHRWLRAVVRRAHPQERRRAGHVGGLRRRGWVLQQQSAFQLPAR